MLAIGTRVRIIGQSWHGVGILRTIGKGPGPSYLVEYPDGDVIWMSGDVLEVVDDTKEEPAMEDEALDKMKALIYRRMEADVAENDDGWQHSYLLPLYLQLKTLDALQDIHNHLGSIEIAIMDLNPTYK